MHGSEIYQQVYTVDRIMKELRGKNKALLNLFIAKFLVLMQIHLKCCIYIPKMVSIDTVARIAGLLTDIE